MPIEWSAVGSATTSLTKSNANSVPKLRSQLAESGLFLVLLRSALPRLDPKTASKLAAALEFAADQGIRSKHLAAFLHSSGWDQGSCAR
jgi:hypothetical protein